LKICKKNKNEKTKQTFHGDHICKKKNKTCCPFIYKKEEINYYLLLLLLFPKSSLAFQTNKQTDEKLHKT